MAAGSFQVGQRFIVGEVPHRLVRQIEGDLWAIEDIHTGRFTEDTTIGLLGRWERGELIFLDASGSPQAPKSDGAPLRGAFEDAFRQSYQEHLWRRAKEKLTFIMKLSGAPFTAPLIVDRIRDVWESLTRTEGGSVYKRPPHFTTVADWKKKYRDAGGDIRVLIDRHHDKGSHDSKVEDVVDRIADDLIRTSYMSLERPSRKTVLKDLRAMVGMQNLGRLASEQIPRPSMNYLRRRILQIPEYDRYAARYGKRAADIKFRAAGTGAPAETPLARACIDHCRMDVMVVDEKSGLPLGRPWLTLILDECSRYVLGFYLGFEEPSSVSVAKAVRNALMPKTELRKGYPKIVNEWDAWGIMHLLVADNGMELHANALEQAIGRFGINLQFCPRMQPWYKGKIERFFGTIAADLLSAIPGRTFASIFERGDYNPTKHAVVRLSTLREVVTTWIVDIYHQTPHGGLDGTPAQTWRDGVQRVDRWLPPSSIAVDSAFSDSIKRKLTHKGIENDCLLYNSNELGAARQRYGSEIAVEVRVMDEDLGSIVVVLPEGELIRVPALDQAYANGLTRWQHSVCKRYKRRLLDDQSIEISLFAARCRIRELIAADMRLTKRGSRKKQARFMEGQSESAISVKAATSERIGTAKAQLPSSPNVVPLDEDEVPMISGRRTRHVETTVHA